MSEPHRMQLPREVLIGPNTVNEISQILLKLSINKNILVLTGENTKNLAGSGVADSLKKSGFIAEMEVVGKASREETERVYRKYSKRRIDLVLAVGGGKVIDIAKVLAYNISKPFISVPTTASHDGIASPRASIKGVDKVYSIQAEAPLAIIADTSIIMKAPYRLFASGCADLISNSTAVRDWRLAHEKTGEYFGDYAASLANLAAEIIIKNAHLICQYDESSIRLVLEGLISSGVAMAIAGSSRPASGAEHLFSHSIDLLSENDALHGEKCGVGTIITMFLQKGDWRRIRDTLKILGAPTNAAELGLSKEILIDAVVKAPGIRPERYTILNEVTLDRGKVERILKKINII